MYSAIFYSIFVLIIFSLIFKFNPNFYNDLYDYARSFEIQKIQIIDDKKEIEQEKHYGFDERVQRGDFYFKEGFLDLSAAEYSNALLLKKNSDVYKKLSEIQILQGNYDKAENNILSAISMQSSDDLLLDLIKIKIKKNEFESAKELLNKIQNNSEKKDYYLLIIGLLNPEYKPDADFISNTINTSTDLNIKVKLQSILDAINEFNSYKDGKHEHFRLLLAKSLIRSFEFEIALKMAKDITSLRPDYRDAWILLGYSQLRLGKLDDALSSLNAAHDFDTTKPETQFYLGLAYEDLSKLDLAKDFYNKALKNGYQPKSQVVQKLAELASKQGDNNLAIEMYKEMLSLNSEDVKNFYIPIEILLEKSNDPALALKFAQWAQRCHSDNAFSYTLLGLTLFKNGDTEGAKTNIQKSIQMDPSIPENYLYAGMILEQGGDIKFALMQYEMAYKKNTYGKIGREAIKRYNELLKRMKR